MGVIQQCQHTATVQLLEGESIEQGRDTTAEVSNRSGLRVRVAGFVDQGYTAVIHPVCVKSAWCLPPDVSVACVDVQTDAAETGRGRPCCSDRDTQEHTLHVCGFPCCCNSQLSGLRPRLQEFKHFSVLEQTMSDQDQALDAAL